MQQDFDFDQLLNRDHSNSLKYDGRQAMFGSADVIPLWVADMDFASPPAISEALLQRAKHPIYGYSSFPESIYQSLMDWLERRHGWRIQREWIVLCPGVVPSLNAAVMAFSNPGDAVIVQPPVYFPFFPAVTDSGRSLIQNQLRLENNQYHIDFEHLEACAARAKMLLLCSPHNPVGRVWRKDELERLLAIAEKYQLIIFADEIHSDLVYPPAKHQVLETLSTQQVNIITAVAPSKTFNVPGLNLSALIIPDATQRLALTKVFERMHVSVTNPFSMVAFEAAYQHGDAWLDALLGYLQQTRDFVLAYVSEHLPRVHAVVPEGTYLIWLDCRELGLDDAALKQFFIQQAGVGLSPGRLFGEAGSGFMRMNIAAPRLLITTALQSMAGALQSFTK
ncbi:MAG: PatB family C-S lyase [Methylotenera sp.]|uniref:MalY/PatB family protein n=1 Tax=Methylotenera sp. TaxID=2051956 RepID=UPI002719AC7E|nr:PatB family C-S lyase [Methylotenera sp.]MDO9151201.1 PatB family C-S lyase [Methylotenera sp.]